ncbi:MAG: hypothetical protein EP344_05640 [Bacteroidetes bacterium]|nr:MAG: hypothetical protein EP344_05640 [Bacteroidota bacterium]
MQRITGLLLLLSLLAPVLGTGLWLHWQKVKIRRHVRHQILLNSQPDALVLLRFSQADAQQLNWEHAGEFEYLHQMYDVVKTETHTDSIFYTCWPDRKETHLNRQIAGLISIILADSPDRQKHQQQVLDFFKSLFVYNAGNFRLKQIVFCKNYFPFLSVRGGFEKAPPTPPPRL